MAKKPTTADQVTKSIKGFNQDLTCRGFQYEIGKTYTHNGGVEQCLSGFHACPVEHHPLSVFEFYAPAGSRFFEVTQGGKTSNGGTKLASATITIDFEITIGELVKRAWDYVWSRATKSDEAHVTVDNGAASATGDQGAASATGDLGAASATGTRGAASATGTRGAASVTGDLGAASATGDLGAASVTGTRGAASATGTRGAASATGTRGAASVTGDLGAASATGDLGAASATGTRGAASATGTRGAASVTGYQGAASATGYQGAASATGDLGAASVTGYQGAASATGTRGAAISSYVGKVMGADGNALFAIERDDNLDIASVASGIVGRDGIKANVWYVCRASQLVEA
jgi:hypothetical protein